MGKFLLFASLACLLTVAPIRAEEAHALRFGFETPRTDSQFIGAEYMARLVAERSGGRLELRLHPDGVLGRGPTMLADMRAGGLDIYMGGSGFFANLANKLNILDIPFLFRDVAHVDRMLEGDFGRLLLDELDAHGMKGLAFWENGFRCLTNSRNTVEKADDVKGLKLRVMANPMHVEAWTLLGAEPVPMSLSELYSALASGAVEGQDHPLNVAYSTRLYEVQKHVTVSNHAYSPLIVAMNLEKFNALPADLRELLVECAIEGARHQKKYIRANIGKMATVMAEEGCIITPADKVDLDSFIGIVGERTRAMYLRDFGGDTGEAWLGLIDEGGGER